MCLMFILALMGFELVLLDLLLEYEYQIIFGVFRAQNSIFRSFLIVQELQSMLVLFNQQFLKAFNVFSVISYFLTPSFV